MKQVIFKRNDGYYMTSAKNYNSYIWNAREIKKLHGVNTREDVIEFIEKICVFYDDDPGNYAVID